MARKLAAFSTLLALVSFVSAQSAGPWGQCGGQGWTGPTSCPSGWTCVKSNDFYSQCLQGGPTTTAPTSCPSTTVTVSTQTIMGACTARPVTVTVTPTAMAKRDGTAGPWDQCGGQGWTGATTCVSGYTCVVEGTFYSQCQPDSIVTTTPTTTPPTTTPPTTSPTATPTGCSPPSITLTSTVTVVVTPTCAPTTVTVTATSGSPTATPSGLHSIAKSVGKTYFGTATDNPELTDIPYKTKLSDNKEFGIITPGNSMKWDATEPSRGTFTFSGGDAIVSLAQGNGQMVRCHTTVWHSQLPSWVTAGNFDNATLISIVQSHVTNVISHYKGDCYAWDVVNEVFNDDGTWRSSVFHDTIGPEFVPIAFQAARAADPDVKLYINDYNIEGSGAKSTAMFNLVKSLKERGIPIDGIGVQGHLIVGAVPTSIQQNLEQFTSLGVEVALTELDIRMNVPATDSQLQQQKTDYKNVVSACNAVPKCIGVTVWDWTDKYSWIPGVFSGQGAALPWDENLVKKPAYDGIVAALT